MNQTLTLEQLCNFIKENKKFINKNEIKILDNETEETNYKITQLEIGKSANIFPLNKKLNNILNIIAKQDNYKRIGVISIVKNYLEKDISFVSSILTLLINNFNTYTEEIQCEIIETFFRKLYKEAKDKYKEFKYNNLGWVQKEFLLHVKEVIFSRDLLRYITDYLHINIIIISFFEDSLKYIGDEKFVKYKKTLFLAKYEEHYEPIICDSQISLITKIINTPLLVEKIDCNLKNKNEDCEFIISNCDLDITETKMEIIKVSEANSYNELKEIAKKLNIKITQNVNGKNSMKTKTILISEINEKQIFFIKN